MPYSHHPMARASPFVTVGSYLKNMGSASDMAMNATQPPIVIIMRWLSSDWPQGSDTMKSRWLPW